MIGWGSCAVFQQRRDMLVGYHELYLQTAWQNRGIELPVTRLLEQRVSELRASHPSPEAVYKLFIPETNLYACGIAEAAGYQQVAEHAMMVRPHLDGIPQAVFPPEIEVRPFAEEHLHQVYEAVTEAFIEHIHGSDPSEEGFQEWCAEDYLQDRSLWVIAWDVRSNKIAGLILNFILKDENEYYQRKRGYVEHIAVLKPYRRMGLARAMIALSLKKHKDRGMHEAGLSCHTGNPFNPLSLYFAMGFETRYLLRVYSKPIQPLL
jgi:GNAT superfamily N-acetyltransferase